MEIVLNVYLKNIAKKSEIDLFLFPDYFFINNDRSYCYIIEKYDIDLYKYFNVLGKHNTIFTLTDILHILKFIVESIKFMFQNNIIHGDIKLENIVLNYEISQQSIPKINTLKLIDFDVSLFNSIPERLNPIPDEFKKAFNNKKVRGTKIYMLNDTCMSFKSDIYSLGMVLLIILFKNIKLLISLKKNTLNAEIPSNKKTLLRYNTLIKRLNTLRNDINIYDNKLKIINLIKEFIEKSSSLNFFTTINDKLRFSILLDLIKDCIKTKYDIEELEDKYQSIINQ
jgi:serine/threonine protein kinase